MEQEQLVERLLSGKVLEDHDRSERCGILNRIQEIGDQSVIPALQEFAQMVERAEYASPNACNTPEFTRRLDREEVAQTIEIVSVGGSPELRKHYGYLKAVRLTQDPCRAIEKLKGRLRENAETLTSLRPNSNLLDALNMENFLKQRRILHEELKLLEELAKRRAQNGARMA